MLVYATADLHGNLPEVPACDLLLIGGDVCPMESHDLTYQFQWLDSHFRDWLSDIPAKKIIGIAGNHDFAFEHRNHIESINLPWIYLCDEATMWNGLKIYGTPWVPNLPRWAFHLKKEALAQKYNAIPNTTDIVLSHGPPHGYGDALLPQHRRASEGYVANCGPKSATDMMLRVKPKAFICGHIHEGFGHYWLMHRDLRTDTEIYNVSYVDENYVPRGNIVQITLDDAPEEPTDPISEVRSEDSDARPTPEPTA